MTDTLQPDGPKLEPGSDKPAAEPSAAGATAEPIVAYRARPHWFLERLHFTAYIVSYWIARLIGRRGAAAVFSRLGTLSAGLLGLKRRARGNLELVKPELGAAEQRRIIDGVCSNFARTAFEYAFLDKLTRAAEGWRVEGLEHFLAAREAAGGRVVVASAHFGNWEAIRAFTASRGAPLAIIYRAFNNKLVDQHIHRKMTELGWPAFRKGQVGGRQLFKHVRSGQGALILVDQRLGGAPIIDFMGRPAETSIAAAQLARTLKAPLLTASALRLEDDNFVVRFDPPVPPGRPDEMMAEVNRRIEGWVEEAPEQWLWMHRRWKVRQTTRLRKFGARQEGGAEEGEAAAPELDASRASGS